MPTMKSIKFPGYDESFEVVDAAARERLDNQDKTIGDKLDADKLPEAINTALAQAKESGEFNGENGVSPTVTASKSGKATTITISDVNGTRETVINDGADGVSPAIAVSAITGGHRITITDADGSKTVDVMDGGKGSDGRGIRTIARTSGSGASGTTDTYTITYTDGTTSTFGVYNGKDGTNGASVTVKSVSESTVDGGSNVVEFSDGKTVTIKNGSKGAKGDPGYTPVKFVDYYTDADQEAIVQQVIAALGTPVFGRVDADNTLILSGDLAVGTYYIKYENAEGKISDVCTYEVAPDGPVEIPLTWEFNTKLSKTDGSIESTSDTTYCATAFIELDPAKTYTLNREATGISDSCSLCWYDSTGAFIKYDDSYVAYGMPGGISSRSLPVPMDAAKLKLRLYKSNADAGAITSCYNLIAAKIDKNNPVYAHTLYKNATGVTQMASVGSGDNRSYINLAASNSLFNIVQLFGEQELYSDSAFTKPTGYFPIKIPAGATSVKVVFDNLYTGKNLVMRQWGMKYADGVYTRVGSVTAWTAGGVLEQAVDAEWTHVVIEVMREDYTGFSTSNLSFDGVHVEWL